MNATSHNELIGTVTIGLGEGKYYMSLPPYAKQFKKKLEFKPYPATLNLIVKNNEAKGFIENLKLIYIEGFKIKKRTFGSLNCHLVRLRINKAGRKFIIDGAIAIPEIIHHSKDIIEVIAPVSLKDKFGLKNGDIVTLLNKNDKNA